jgi:hypothetical protein
LTTISHCHKKQTHACPHSSPRPQLTPPLPPSQVDLKLALIIGNSHYESDDEEIKFCRQCANMQPNYNLANLNLCSSFQLLKPRLQELGYLVMSFVDVDVDRSSLSYLSIQISIMFGNIKFHINLKISIQKY